MRFLSRLHIFVVCLVVFGFASLTFVPRADAQVLYGSVTGTVTDQSGASVPKAHLVVVNRATRVTREADADDTGHYLIVDLPPGDYDLTVKVSGFKPLTQTNLRVTANTVTNADASLQVGTMSQQVTVEASTVSVSGLVIPISPRSHSANDQPGFGLAVTVNCVPPAKNSPVGDSVTVPAQFGSLSDRGSARAVTL